MDKLACQNTQEVSNQQQDIEKNEIKNILSKFLESGIKLQTSEDVNSLISSLVENQLVIADKQQYIVSTLSERLGLGAQFTPDAALLFKKNNTGGFDVVKLSDDNRNEDILMLVIDEEGDITKQKFGNKVIRFDINKIQSTQKLIGVLSNKKQENNQLIDDSKFQLCELDEEILPVKIAVDNLNQIKNQVTLDPAPLVPLINQSETLEVKDVEKDVHQPEILALGDIQTNIVVNDISKKEGEETEYIDSDINIKPKELKDVPNFIENSVDHIENQQVETIDKKNELVEHLDITDDQKQILSEESHVDAQDLNKSKEKTETISYTEYSIKSGDNLWKIMRAQYGLSNPTDIANILNTLKSDPNFGIVDINKPLRINQKIKLPSAVEVISPSRGDKIINLQN